MTIKIKRGNILDHPFQGTDIYIMHCVNNIGKMGSGVAKAISDKWFNVKSVYIEDHINSNLELGSYNIINVSPGKFVVNIVGQDGIKYFDNPKPIRYWAIERAMKDFTEQVKSDECQIIMPLLGSGLAQGNFDIIYSIVKDVLSDYNVVIYYLEKDKHKVETFIS